ncbi:MAG TPA: hypothetical protein VKT80_09540 [Chloroflexota bacterium]|nr:hypothetical protein [Chloroflexota bacterium]
MMKLEAESWPARVNKALEEMLYSMRILAANHPPAADGSLAAVCNGAGDKIEVVYTKTGEAKS